MLLLVDFEKAFDSLEWDYLNQVFKFYNFGESFIHWYNILYKNCCSTVINNGNFSEFFYLGRGNRQEDPLSACLFILAIEPLSCYIKNNIDIVGITVNDIMHKTGQYADDTFLTLDGSEKSLRESVYTLQQFYHCSGLKVNVKKHKLFGLDVSRTEKNLFVTI